nr:hypothetical protein [uncultured Eubacterium sp.]
MNKRVEWIDLAKGLGMLWWNNAQCYICISYAIILYIIRYSI